MKDFICTVLGLTGSAVTTLLGGWSAGMTTLLMFMIIDYVSGLCVAGIFKKSKKSENGALQSKAGWKGLCKKGMMLAIVLVAYRIDLMIGTSYAKDAVIIGFVVNETISIIENAGLMGLPLPDAIMRAVDVLNEKAKENQNM